MPLLMINDVVRCYRIGTLDSRKIGDQVVLWLVFTPKLLCVKQTIKSFIIKFSL